MRGRGKEIIERRGCRELSTLASAFSYSLSFASLFLHFQQTRYLRFHIARRSGFFFLFFFLHTHITLRGISVYGNMEMRLHLPELCPAAAHDLVLANQLGAELAAVQRKVDVKVDPVEDALGCVHALEVGFKVLA